jgi:hypothetical protein
MKQKNNQMQRASKEKAEFKERRVANQKSIGKNIPH